MELPPSSIIIGVDEAGRGPLFGRVYTASMVMHSSINQDNLKDSKKFTSKKKITEVFNHIQDNCKYYAVDYAECDEIDKFNILQATQRSMHRSVLNTINQLIANVEDDADVKSILENIIICVDGNYFNTFKYFYNDQFYIINHKTLIKGDSLCKEISGASILAKVSRDLYIEKFVEENPEYDEKYKLTKNKGYATKAHIEGIRQYGYSTYHRKSFKLKSL
jgi:ribonuclease HII